MFKSIFNFLLSFKNKCINLLSITLVFITCLFLTQLNPLSEDISDRFFTEVVKLTPTQNYNNISIVSSSDRKIKTDQALKYNLNKIFDNKPQSVFVLTKGAHLGDCESGLISKENIFLVLTDENLSTSCINSVSENADKFFYYNTNQDIKAISSVYSENDIGMTIYNSEKSVDLMNFKNYILNTVTLKKSENLYVKIKRDRDSISIFDDSFLSNRHLSSSYITNRIVIYDNLEYSSVNFEALDHSRYLANIFIHTNDSKYLESKSDWLYYFVLLVVFLQTAFAVYSSSFLIGIWLLGFLCVEIIAVTVFSISELNAVYSFADAFTMLILSTFGFQVLRRKKIEKEIKSISKLILHNADWGLQSVKKLNKSPKVLFEELNVNLDLEFISLVSFKRKSPKFLFDSGDLDRKDLSGFFKKEFIYYREGIFSYKNFNLYIVREKERDYHLIYAVKKEKSSSSLSMSVLRKLSKEIFDQVDIYNEDKKDKYSMSQKKQFSFAMEGIKKLLRLNRELKIALNSLSIPKATFNLMGERIYSNNEFIELLKKSDTFSSGENLISTLCKLSTLSKGEILYYFNHLLENFQSIDVPGHILINDSLSVSDKTKIHVRITLKVVELQGFNMQSDIKRIISAEIFEVAREKIKIENFSIHEINTEQTLDNEKKVSSTSSIDMNLNNRDTRTLIEREKPGVEVEKEFDIIESFKNNLKKDLEEKNIGISSLNNVKFTFDLNMREQKLFHELWRSILSDTKPSTTIDLSISADNKQKVLSIKYSSVGIFEIHNLYLSSPFNMSLINELKTKGLHIHENNVSDQNQFDIIIKLNNSDKIAA